VNRQQCPYLVNRATTYTDRTPVWFSKSQRYLCGVPRESARLIFLHRSNCEWRLISGHVGKLAVNYDDYVLIPCDLFIWGIVKDSVYVPPLPTPIQKLCDQITQAITADMLHRVWDEFDYRVDVCRVTQGAYIEGL
jgi:hypothetical protein